MLLSVHISISPAFIASFKYSFLLCDFSPSHLCVNLKQGVNHLSGRCNRVSNMTVVNMSYSSLIICKYLIDSLKKEEANVKDFSPWIHIKKEKKSRAESARSDCGFRCTSTVVWSVSISQCSSWGWGFPVLLRPDPELLYLSLLCGRQRKPDS